MDFNGNVFDRWPCGSSPIPSPRPCVSSHRASRLVVENGEGNGGTGPCPLEWEVWSVLVVMFFHFTNMISGNFRCEQKATNVEVVVERLYGVIL